MARINGILHSQKRRYIEPLELSIDRHPKLFSKSFYINIVKSNFKLRWNNNLLPDFQFGFRKSRSTVTAATVLYEAIYQRLRSKPKSSKTYVCFVDFAKCFDSVHRDILFIKLQKLGFPTVLCELLHFVYANTKFYIRSGIHQVLVEAFETSIGLPQGCCTVNEKLLEKRKSSMCSCNFGSHQVNFPGFQFVSSEIKSNHTLATAVLVNASEFQLNVSECHQASIFKMKSSQPGSNPRLLRNKF